MINTRCITVIIIDCYSLFARKGVPGVVRSNNNHTVIHKAPELSDSLMRPDEPPLQATHCRTD